MRLLQVYMDMFTPLFLQLTNFIYKIIWGNTNPQRDGTFLHTFPSLPPSCIPFFSYYCLIPLHKTKTQDVSRALEPKEIMLTKVLK